MSDQFYRAFEERYYASQATIKSLRRQYLPFVAPLTQIYPGASAFDAGCGRGEWLELMQECGFDAQGVDLDEGMLAACREKGLRAAQADAITALIQLPSDSHAVVSAFHVVEHISFEGLRAFVAEAYRVLKPGGILIMETPNPENIFVATRNFYLDPTHVRPIPQELLTFVAGFAGFSRVKVLRLQEDIHLFNKRDISMRDVLFGVSPDYAVVSQKDAPRNIFALLDPQFDRDYGLSIDQLLEKFEDRLMRQEHTAHEALNVGQSIHSTFESQLRELSWITKQFRELLWVAKQLRLLREQGAMARFKVFVHKVRLKLGRYYDSLTLRLHPKLIKFSRALGIHQLLYYRKIRPDEITPRTLEVMNVFKSALKRSSKRRD